MQGEGCAGPPACPAAAARPVSPEPQKIPAAAAKAGRGRGGGSRGRRRGRRGAGEGEAGEGMGLAARQHRHPAALAWSHSHGGRQPRPPSCCHPSHPAWGGCGQRCPQHRHIPTGPGPKVPWGSGRAMPLGHSAPDRLLLGHPLLPLRTTQDPCAGLSSAPGTTFAPAPSPRATHLSVGQGSP